MPITLAPGLELPSDVVTQTIAVLAKRGAGKSNAAAVLVEELHAAGLPFVVIDPVASWWGLRSSRDGSGPGLEIPIFGGEHGDVPLERTGGKLIADLVAGERLSCVLDLFDLSKGDRARFLEDFAVELYRKNREPLHLILEEADDFMPQRVPAEKARLFGAWDDIVRRGRVRGLGLTMISQRSAVLNKDVLTQAETLVALRTTAPQDRDAIKRWVEHHGAREDILSSLATLADGEAWVWSPHWLGTVKRVKFRRRQTFDSGATPKHASGGKAKRPATLADVDLGAIATRMAETIERAKAEDPKELRARIKALEKELAEAKAAKPKNPFLELDLSPLAEVAVALDRAREKLVASMGLPAETIRGDRETHRNARETLTRIPGPIERFPIAKRAAPAQPIILPVEGISRPQQRILDALAWLESVRVVAADRTRVAMLAEASPTSSSFSNNLGALRTAGLIDYPATGSVSLTEAGRQAATFTGAPLTAEALWDSIRARVSGPQWRILAALIDCYPHPRTKEALAELAEASATSSSFSNNLGALRSLGFLDYPAPGQVVATPLVMLD